MTRQQRTQELDPSLTDANRDMPMRPAVAAPIEVPIATDIPCDSCGYNLRSLATSAACPECGRPVSDSLVHSETDAPASRVDRRWAATVLAGLIAFVALYPSELWIVLNMTFPDVAFGTAPKLNVPGPKVWAVPLVQRSIGGHAEWLGAQGTWLPLLSLVTVGMMTMPRRIAGATIDRFTVLRLAARWLPVVLLGGYFGFLLNAEDTYSSDIAVSKYSMFGVVGVELPCTVLLLGYLAHLAGTLNERPLRLRFYAALIGTVIAQCLGVGMTLVSGELASQRKDLLVQIWSALYEAFCCTVALITLGAMLGLMWSLATRLAPRNWRRSWT